MERRFSRRPAQQTADAAVTADAGARGGAIRGWSRPRVQTVAALLEQMGHPVEYTEEMASRIESGLDRALGGSWRGLPVPEVIRRLQSRLDVDPIQSSAQGGSGAPRRMRQEVGADQIDPGDRAVDEPQNQAPAAPEAGVIVTPAEVEARKAELKQKHGLAPKGYGGLFNNSNRAETLFNGALPHVVAFINERFRANGYPGLTVTAAELATNFIMEGGFHALDEDNADEIEGYGELGIDTLVSQLSMLKPWLHESVLEYANNPREVASAQNERGQMVKSIGYIDIVAGLYANAGMYAASKAMASKDLAAKGSPMAKMPQDAGVYWSTMYFNAGRPLALERMTSGGPGLHKRPYRGRDDNNSGPEHNAALRTSSFELMRDTVRFDHPDHGAFAKGPWGVQKGTIPIDIETTSLDDKELTVKVEYSVDGSTFRTCSGPPVTGSSGGREGESHEFSWDSAADLPGHTGVVMMRITSTDGARSGLPQPYPLFVANGPLDLTLTLVSAPGGANGQEIRIAYPVALAPTHIRFDFDDVLVAPFVISPGTIAVPLQAIKLAAGATSVKVMLRNDPTSVESPTLDVPLGGSGAAANAGSQAFAFGMGE